MKQPPCAQWNVWVGGEVEGAHDRGVPTVFIRRLPEGITEETNMAFLTQGGKYRRVWFCKEFFNWPLVRAIAKHFEQICMEVEPKCYDSLPLEFRQNFRIYVKVNLPLKTGDVVCVGPAFEDESFTIGTGIKVKPADYLNDIRKA